jgi:hypothetical protein
VDSDAQYIIKLEPLDNGSLSAEINYYRRLVKSEMIEEWKRGRMLNHLGLRQYIGSGSRVYKTYPFLVPDRHGQDLDELFSGSERFSVKTDMVRTSTNCFQGMRDSRLRQTWSGPRRTVFGE